MIRFITWEDSGVASDPSGLMIVETESRRVYIKLASEENFLGVKSLIERAYRDGFEEGVKSQLDPYQEAHQ